MERLMSHAAGERDPILPILAVTLLVHAFVALKEHHDRPSNPLHYLSTSHHDWGLPVARTLAAIALAMAILYVLQSVGRPWPVGQRVVALVVAVLVSGVAFVGPLSFEFGNAHHPYTRSGLTGVAVADVLIAVLVLAIWRTNSRLVSTDGQASVQTSPNAP
jgi:hypothetical protein